MPIDAAYTLEVTSALQSVQVRDAVGSVVLQGSGTVNLRAGDYSIELTSS